MATQTQRGRREDLRADPTLEEEEAELDDEELDEDEEEGDEDEDDEA
jgi:hypothetical protein